MIEKKNYHNVYAVNGLNFRAPDNVIFVILTNQKHMFLTFLTHDKRRY